MLEFQRQGAISDTLMNKLAHELLQPDFDVSRIFKTVKAREKAEQESVGTVVSCGWSKSLPHLEIGVFESLTL